MAEEQGHIINIQQTKTPVHVSTKTKTPTQCMAWHHSRVQRTCCSQPEGQETLGGPWHCCPIQIWQWWPWNQCEQAYEGSSGWVYWKTQNHHARGCHRRNNLGRAAYGIPDLEGWILTQVLGTHTHWMESRKETSLTQKQKKQRNCKNAWTSMEWTYLSFHTSKMNSDPLRKSRRGKPES